MYQMDEHLKRLEKETKKLEDISKLLQDNIKQNKRKPDAILEDQRGQKILCHVEENARKLEEIKEKMGEQELKEIKMLLETQIEKTDERDRNIEERIERTYANVVASNSNTVQRQQPFTTSEIKAAVTSAVKRLYELVKEADSQTKEGKDKRKEKERGSEEVLEKEKDKNKTYNIDTTPQAKMYQMDEHLKRLEKETKKLEDVSKLLQDNIKQNKRKPDAILEDQRGQKILCHVEENARKLEEIKEKMGEQELKEIKMLLETQIEKTDERDRNIEERIERTYANVVASNSNTVQRQQPFTTSEIKAAVTSAVKRLYELVKEADSQTKEGKDKRKEKERGSEEALEKVKDKNKTYNIDTTPQAKMYQMDEHLKRLEKETKKLEDISKLLQDNIKQNKRKPDAILEDQRGQKILCHVEENARKLEEIKEKMGEQELKEIKMLLETQIEKTDERDRNIEERIERTYANVVASNSNTVQRQQPFTTSEIKAAVTSAVKRLYELVKEADSQTKEGKDKRKEKERGSEEALEKVKDKNKTYNIDTTPQAKMYQMDEHLKRLEKETKKLEDISKLLQDNIKQNKRKPDAILEDQRGQKILCHVEENARKLEEIKEKMGEQELKEIKMLLETQIEKTDERDRNIEERIERTYANVVASNSNTVQRQQPFTTSEIKAAVTSAVKRLYELVKEADSQTKEGKDKRKEKERGSEEVLEKEKDKNKTYNIDTTPQAKMYQMDEHLKRLEKETKKLEDVSKLLQDNIKQNKRKPDAILEDQRGQKILCHVEENARKLEEIKEKMGEQELKEIKMLLETQIEKTDERDRNIEERIERTGNPKI
ncbi:cingulin [Pieris brassicae]|uniref:cingulin n=1 Tax=Pieris brassicae TaxID=7116 RepID=UPI001E66216F|nr:cingulin [Pieris brassicae]